MATDKKDGQLVLPLEDPIAALNFCRALAAAMQCDAQPTQDHGQVSQLHVISKQQDGARPLPPVVDRHSSL